MVTTCEHASQRKPSSVSENTRMPIVLVPGMGGPSVDEGSDYSSWVYSYWGEADKMSTASSPVLCVWPAGFGSLHDRACEIFAQLKGGVVDYGEEHSCKFKHSRFGRKYEGLFPEWSSKNPIHMVGHSLGGNTIRVLQCLLKEKAFPGHDTSEDWIFSVSTLNSPLNGTLAAYSIGREEVDADNVVKLSPGHIACSFVVLALYLNLRPLGCDLGLEQWDLSYRKWSWFGGLRRFCQNLLDRSDLVESADNGFYDTSVHSMLAWNQRIGHGAPGTYYFSYVGTAANANQVPRVPAQADASWPRRYAQWGLKLVEFGCRRGFLSWCKFITRRRAYADLRAALPDVPWEFLSGGSDGLVPSASQTYPQVGLADATPNAPLPADPAALRAGVWYVSQHGQDHMGIVPLSPDPAAQASFFASLFARLRALPRPAPLSAPPPASPAHGVALAQPDPRPRTLTRNLKASADENLNPGSRAEHWQPEAAHRSHEVPHVIAQPPAAQQPPEPAGGGGEGEGSAGVGGLPEQGQGGGTGKGGGKAVEEGGEGRGVRRRWGSEWSVGGMGGVPVGAGWGHAAAGGAGRQALLDMHLRRRFSEVPAAALLVS